MALTKTQLHALVASKLVDKGKIPAVDHREVEDAIIDALIDNAGILDILNAYSFGASYLWSDSNERNAETGMASGERGLQIDTGDLYEYNGSVWNLVGAMSGLGIDESNLVHKSGAENITGIKTFTVLTPELNATSHADISTDYDIVDKKYVDDQIAGASASNQTVEVTASDTTPGRLFDKIVNLDGYINISVGSAGGNEDLVIDFNEGSNLHDGFGDYVANEHIDHTLVNLNAGSGLSGGGNISASRTFNVDINSETAIPNAALDDELLISDTSNSNAIRKIKVSDLVGASSVKETISGTAQYWYDTIQEQTSNYLYNSPANADTKLLLKINGTIGKTYELVKANFYYIDSLTEETTSPAIKIYQNTIDRFSAAGSQTITPGNNNLLTNLNSGVIWNSGDDINIYVNTGTGTPNGSQIHGYFYWEVKEI